MKLKNEQFTQIERKIKSDIGYNHHSKQGRGIDDIIIKIVISALKEYDEQVNECSEEN